MRASFGIDYGCCRHDIYPPFAVSFLTSPFRACLVRSLIEVLRLIHSLPLTQRNLIHLQDPGYERGPAGLVARPKTVPVIAVKILVEEDQLAPVRIVGEPALGAVAGTPTLRV